MESRCGQRGASEDPNAEVPGAVVGKEMATTGFKFWVNSVEIT